MTIYESIKLAVNVLQAAAHYGIPVDRSSKCCCLFHQDKHPSMKLNDDYYYCFACHASGDVISLTAKLFDLNQKEAAEKLAADFGMKPSEALLQATAQKAAMRSVKDEREHTIVLLNETISILRWWKEEYAPKHSEEGFNENFVDACKYLEFYQHLSDILSFGHPAEAATVMKYIKAKEMIPTLEDRIDIERKGVQSTQGVLYVRFACFGNGTLHALYDRSNGFYRRQLLITVKERKADRQDDPYLIEKLRSERDGILIWSLEGLQRLIANGYQFTISPRMEQNLQEAVAESNNLVQFMESSGYIVLEKGTVACSTALYRTYENWCSDNLEKPLSQKNFTQFLRQNKSSYGITYSKHAVRDQRGFHGIHVKYMN